MIRRTVAAPLLNAYVSIPPMLATIAIYLSFVFIGIFNSPAQLEVRLSRVNVCSNGSMDGFFFARFFANTKSEQHNKTSKKCAGEWEGGKWEKNNCCFHLFQMIWMFNSWNPNIVRQLTELRFQLVVFFFFWMIFVVVSKWFVLLEVFAWKRDTHLGFVGNISISTMQIHLSYATKSLSWAH